MTPIYRSLLATVAAAVGVSVPAAFGVATGATPTVSELTATLSDSAPVWSPDGKWIAFIRTFPRGTRAPDDDATQIYVVRANGAGVRRLVRVVGSTLDPNWSPDGRRLAFVRGIPQTNPPKGEIDIVRRDGHRLRRLTDGTWPVWSADGRSLAFTRYRGADAGLYTISPRGTDLHLVVAAPHAARPSWSSDGEKLAYEVEGTIYTVGAAGGTPTQIGLGYIPVWSPRARRLAFVGPNFCAILVVDDGETAKRDPECPHVMSVWAPTWSPSGRDIAYTECLNASCRVFVAPATSNKAIVRPEHRLVQCGKEATWAPNGASLAVSSMKPTARVSCRSAPEVYVGNKLFVVRARDGKVLRRLTGR